MALLLTTLMMFGVPLLFLDANTEYGNYDLIESSFNFWVLDLVYNQYLLSLGEFNMDGFEDHPERVLVILFFIASTFFTQLTMLNMLIAIMGDSFAKVTENSEINGIIMKL